MATEFCSSDTPLTLAISPLPSFPSPTWPEPSAPQHQACEPIAHACEFPQATMLAFETPLTATGLPESGGTAAPLPNWPEEPSPQQYSEPEPGVAPQVNAAPAEISVRSRG